MTVELEQEGPPSTVSRIPSLSSSKSTISFIPSPSLSVKGVGVKVELLFVVSESTWSPLILAVFA